MEEVTNEYLEELDQYEEAVRNQLESEGKIKPVRCRKRKEKTEIVNRRESRTDPESGFCKRKGKAEGMHYLSHETVDSQNGIIIDVAATAGNVPDSQPYIERIDYIEKNLGLKMQEVTVFVVLLSRCRESSFFPGQIKASFSSSY